MKIFDFIDYRLFLKISIQSLPKKGYGQLSKLARFMGVNSAYLSQVLQESKSLSQEQGIVVANYFKLGTRETDYFLLLINFDRAGTKVLKDHYHNKIKLMQAQNEELINRVKVDTKLSEETKAIFYTDWAYSAIRQCTAISQLSSIDKIAEYLSIPPKRVTQILEFLIESGLCVSENGVIKIGHRRTHLEENSPFKKNHIQNWRSRAIDQLYDSWENKLHYSSPMTISHKDAKEIRKIILNMIDNINTVADNSRSEELTCFNVDWFRLNKTPTLI